MVGRVAAAAHVGAVHDVVVEQGGGVDELDDRGGRDVLLALVAAGTGRQHHAQRAQPFAARADDVLGDLVDQHDVAGQPLHDGLVDALQVCP